MNQHRNQDKQSDAAAEASVLHAIVRGRVQGVGFRFFVQRQAEALGLTGWVRNLGDGSVEVQGEGNRPDLELLLGELRRGPLGSRVYGLDQEWLPGAASAAGFRVIG